jgi:hypothetical protein
MTLHTSALIRKLASLERKEDKLRFKVWDGDHYAQALEKLRKEIAYIHAIINSRPKVKRRSK